MTKLRRVLASAILVAAVVACLSTTVAAQTLSDGSIANLVGGGSAARWDIGAANAGGTLTITFPDGRAARKTFRAGASPQISLGEKYFENLPDGVYVYELRLAPVRSAALKDAIGTRAKDDEPESERAGRKRSKVPPMIQSGSFAVVNGSIVVAGAVEPEQPARKASAPTRTSETLSTGTASRIRNNHHAFFKPDFVIADDLVVQGSACVGLDCVNNEPFSFDTIRMKENNTRILFLDTSTAAGFATNDWIIRANSSANGGQSFLAFVDHANAGTGAETGTIVFEVDAGAPANSLRVSSTGNIGIGTATPVLDVHANTSDTPAIRLEQNNSGGFTAQTWDIAGNEANFFVRDVTGGSRLPFRIRPGAPTSSIDISANGSVGVGTASPTTLESFSKLTVQGSDATAHLASIINEGAGQVGLTLRRTGASAQRWFQYIPSGSTDLRFFSAADVMTIQAGGNVGIATTAPTDTLSVNGTASKPGGGSWAVFSDERLKNIKGRFSTGLSAVMRLQPLRYEYKADNALSLKATGESIGFGAQELQKIIPEAVTRNENGYLMVNNDPILWTMLNAIKEQQKEITELKAQVRKLQAASRRRRK